MKIWAFDFFLKLFCRVFKGRKCVKFAAFLEANLKISSNLSSEFELKFAAKSPHLKAHEVHILAARDLELLRTAGWTGEVVFAKLAAKAAAFALHGDVLHYDLKLGIFADSAGFIDFKRAF
jgi:hypothetical protein